MFKQAVWENLLIKLKLENNENVFSELKNYRIKIMPISFLNALREIIEPFR